jgi:hypothetical protein
MTHGVGSIYEIGECNSCNFCVLLHRDRISNSIIAIYPNPLPRQTDSRIPPNIRKDLDEALLCLSIGANRGAAALARRAVQSICQDKGATKKELRDQIDELFTNKIITQELKDWSHEVRYVGNDAAHPNSNDVSKEDSEEIIDLLDSLCEVLYVTPAKASNRKHIREEKKNGTS